MISLVITLSSFDIVLVSLVPFQNFGSLSRSEIMFQTVSTEAVISTDAFISAISVVMFFKILVFDFEIHFKPINKRKLCLLVMMILRNWTYELGAY